jgi:hypothetical protein
MVMVGLLGTLLFAGCSNFLTDSIGVTGEDNPLGDNGFSAETIFDAAIPSYKGQKADEAVDCGYIGWISLTGLLSGDISKAGFQFVDLSEAEEGAKIYGIAGDTYIGVIANFESIDFDTGEATGATITGHSVEQIGDGIDAGDELVLTVTYDTVNCDDLSISAVKKDEDDQLAGGGEIIEDPTVLDGKYSCTTEGGSFDKPQEEEGETFDAVFAYVGPNEEDVPQVAIVDDDGAYVMELYSRGDNVYTLFAQETWSETIYGIDYSEGGSRFARKLTTGEEADSCEFGASFNLTCEQDEDGNLDCDFNQKVDYSDCADYYSAEASAKASRALFKSEEESELDDDFEEEFSEKVSCELISKNLPYDIHDVIIDETSTVNEQLTFTTDNCYFYSSDSSEDQTTGIYNLLALISGQTLNSQVETVDAILTKEVGAPANFTVGDVSIDFDPTYYKNFVWNFYGGSTLEDFAPNVDYSYFDFWVDLESGLPPYFDAYFSVYVEVNGGHKGLSCFSSNDTEFYGDDLYYEDAYALDEFESEDGVVELSLTIDPDSDTCGAGTLDLHSVDGMQLYDTAGTLMFESSEYFEYYYYSFYGTAADSSGALKTELLGAITDGSAYIDTYYGIVTYYFHDVNGGSCEGSVSLYGESGFEGEDGSINFSETAKVSEGLAFDYYESEGDPATCPFLFASEPDGSTDFALTFGYDSNSGTVGIRFENEAQDTEYLSLVDNYLSYQYGNYYGFAGSTYTSDEEPYFYTSFEVENRGDVFDMEYGYYSMYLYAYDEELGYYTYECYESFSFSGSDFPIE